MTLVEMLVATALSLLIVLAVTQVFSLVGDNVLSSRAVAEMSSQLRATSNQLRSDLSQLTVPVRPWTDATTGQGYFEIYEGPLWDMGRGAEAAKGPPWPAAFAETTMGDVDDVLMFTAKSRGAPFTGQVLGTLSPPDSTNTQILTYDPKVRTVIQSNMAEIVWFTSFDDRNGNSRPDPGEVTLHRRVLLVRPDIKISNSPKIQNLTPGKFYTGFDLSIRYQETSPGSGKFTKYTNSLQHLSLRQNRVGHHVGGAFPVTTRQGPLVVRQFPYPLSGKLLAPRGTADGILPIDHPSFSWSLEEEFPYEDEQPETYGDFYGSDVILSQVLAFDVKVYDPEVSIKKLRWDDGNESVVVLPGDPGYRSTLSGIEVREVGKGGYVDLFYSRYASGSSIFSGPPRLRSGLGRQLPAATYDTWTMFYEAERRQLPAATYDTWTMFYEHDGVNQDKRVREILLGFLSPDAVRNRLGPPHRSGPDYTGEWVVDWGTDGIDNNNDGGVDDIGERETSPPYPVPLRGIQVRLRISDPDSRQVRQVTVSSDFIPE